MSTALDHIDAAEAILADLLAMQGPADPGQLIGLHLTVARARIEAERWVWLSGLDRDLADKARRDVHAGQEPDLPAAMAAAYAAGVTPQMFADYCVEQGQG